MPLGLGAGLSKSGIVTPGIVTDNLVLKHKYDAGAVVPVSDGAAYFDGTDDYIDLGNQATSGDDFTMSAWVYLLDNNINTVLQWGDMLMRMNDDTSFMAWADQAGTGSDATVSSGLNKWVHICAVIDDDAVHHYRNGVFIETDTGLSTLSTDSTGSYIGKYSSHYFKGYICNVGLWSATLTQAQIKSIMNKNYAGLSDSEKTNLVSWWNLSADANDSHGSNNGTLS